MRRPASNTAARRVEVVHHPDVEVRFGLGAHGGGEVHHRVDVAQRLVGEQRGEVADQRLDACVAAEVVGRGDPVEQAQPGQRGGWRTGERELVGVEQRPRQAGAEEPGSAGDRDAHAGQCCRPCRRSLIRRQGGYRATCSRPIRSATLAKAAAL